MCKNILLLFTYLICFVFWGREIVPAASSEDPLAVVFYVEGEALKLPGIKDSSKVTDDMWTAKLVKNIKENDKLTEGDYIWVKDGGMVMVKFKDDSTARLGPNTKLLLKGLQVSSSDKDSIVTKMRLELGKVWIQVVKFFGAGASYEVEVEDVVAAVRGTDFAVELLDGSGGDREYNLHVYEGEVQLTDPKVTRPMMLNKNQFVATKLRARLFAIRGFDPENINGWHQWNRDITRRVRLNPELLKNRRQFKERLKIFKEKHPGLWDRLKQKDGRFNRRLLRERFSGGDRNINLRQDVFPKTEVRKHKDMEDKRGDAPSHEIKQHKNKEGRSSEASSSKVPGYRRQHLRK